MSEAFPVVYLARHGETAWTITGQRTGLIDLPLTECGECNARRLGQRLSGLTFAKVFTNPLQRVVRTCGSEDNGYWFAGRRTFGPRKKSRDPVCLSGYPSGASFGHAALPVGAVCNYRRSVGSTRSRRKFRNAEYVRRDQ